MPDADAKRRAQDLPRYQMRGPIEARKRVGVASSLCSFRAIKCAVPLKLGLCVVLVYPKPTFRAIKCAVPLKQVHFGKFRLDKVTFRAIKCAVPLKQQGKSSGSGAGAPSALSNARSH